MKHLKLFERFSINESLYSSIIRGEDEVAKRLINQGADISERRYMAIKQAINFGKVDILKLLLDNCRPDDNGFPSEVELQGWASSALDHTDEPTRKQMGEIIEDFFNI